MKSLHIALGATKIAILTVALAMSGSLSAAQFGVRVVDNAGLPVSGASVCFGLPGSYRQFGAQFTDADGQATADLPNIPFVVTVSKTRFSGVRISEPARSFNLIKQVKMVEGQPGPRCKAGSTLAQSSDSSSIKITQVEVLSSANGLALMPIVTGEASEYRVGPTPSFESSRWQSLGDTIRLPSQYVTKDEVYLQLRRYQDAGSGWLEARSMTVTVYLPESNPAPSL